VITEFAGDVPLAAVVLAVREGQSPQPAPSPACVWLRTPQAAQPIAPAANGAPQHTGDREAAVALSGGQPRLAQPTPQRWKSRPLAA
jgi:hypothetical protein